MNKQKFNELLKPLIEIYDSIEMDMILDALTSWNRKKKGYSYKPTL